MRIFIAKLTSKNNLCQISELYHVSRLKDQIFHLQILVPDTLSQVKDSETVCQFNITSYTGQIEQNLGTLIKLLTKTDDS